MCFFIKILSLLLNNMFIVDKHCSDVCYDNFRCHKLIAMLKK